MKPWRGSREPSRPRLGPKMAVWRFLQPFDGFLRVFMCLEVDQELPEVYAKQEATA